MSKAVSNKQQMAKLVYLMKCNPDVAKGFCSKKHARERWEPFVKILNSLGPPFKTYEKWARVWVDLKTKTKKKVTAKKREELRAKKKFNGILNVLSPLDEAVDQIMEFSKSFDPLNDISYEKSDDVSCSNSNIREEGETENEYTTSEFENTEHFSSEAHGGRNSLISNVKEEVDEESACEFEETMPLSPSYENQRTTRSSYTIEEYDMMNEVTSSEHEDTRPLSNRTEAQKTPSANAHSHRTILLEAHSRAEKRFHKEICMKLDCIKNSIDMMREQQRDYLQEKLKLLRETNEKTEKYRAEKLRLLRNTKKS